jgi:hypothetical protein
MRPFASNEVSPITITAALQWSSRPLMILPAPSPRSSLSWNRTPSQNQSRCFASLMAPSHGTPSSENWKPGFCGPASHQTATGATASEKGQPRKPTTTASLKRKSKRSVDGRPTPSNDTLKRTARVSSASIDNSKLAPPKESPPFPTFISPPYFYPSYLLGAFGQWAVFRQLFTTRSALQG